MPSGAEPVQHGTEALPATLEPAPEPGPLPAPRQRQRHRLAGAYRDPYVGASSLAVFAAYLAIPLFRLRQLNPSSWDLAIYTEYVKQAASFRAPVADIRTAGFNLLGDHFQPVVMLIAPFFRVFPSAATLVTAQALLTALSVFAVAQAAREKLGPGPSRAIAVAYGLSWGLQQMVAFDFHEIAFAVPLLAFSLSALVRRRLWPAVAWALPLVFVKEDQGFTVAAIGLVIAGQGLARLRAARRAAPSPAPRADAGPPQEPAAWIRAGVLLAVWGLAWSVLAIAVIVPHFNPAHAYPYWNDGGVVGPSGHLSVTGLAHQLTQAGNEKLWTTYLILLPVAFLALRSPVVLTALPSLALRFISTNSYFWGTAWHYNATVMPIVFLAAVDGMAAFRAGSARRARPARRRAPTWLPAPGEAVARYGAVAMVVIAGWLMFRFPLDGLWHAQTYEITSHVSAEDAAMARVPDRVTVEATLTMLAPLAARDDTYWIGITPNPAPAYVVFDADNSGWNPPPSNVLAFVEQRHRGYAYQQIFVDDHVYVFRRAGRTGG